VEELKRDIFNTFKNKLAGISYEGLAKGIADSLQGMDPRSWLQCITHSLLRASIIFTVCLVIFLYRILLSPVTIKILQNFQSHGHTGIATFKK
jgi:hypothetical protein